MAEKTLHPKGQVRALLPDECLAGIKIVATKTVESNRWFKFTVKSKPSQSFLLFYPRPCKKHIPLAYISQSNDVDSCITLMCFLFVIHCPFLCGIGGLRLLEIRSGREGLTWAAGKLGSDDNEDGLECKKKLGPDTWVHRKVRKMKSESVEKDWGFVRRISLKKNIAMKAETGQANV